MKKYFIIAVAAVAAMVACSKVDTIDTAPAKKIAFEVASYTPQTKANSSLATEFYNFKTYAYQFPALGDPVIFMDETIYAWKAASHTDANKAASSTDAIVEWASTDDYFWPKTGHINFYSYAGTQSPDQASASAAADSELTTITFSYTDATIASTDNILVADPAMGKTRANSGASTYDVDPDETASNHITKGVPTLFHHMLTKIQFDVKLKTATTNSNVWKVTVLDQFDANHKSQLIAKNQGTLTLTSAAATNNGAWSPSIATASSASSTDVLWVPTTNGTTEAITLQSEQMTLAANAETSGDAIQLLALRSVMPQLSSGVQLSLTYKVEGYHGDTKYLEEIRTVGLDEAVTGTFVNKYLSDLVNSSVINWLPNKKITYHIVIDPVTEKVTFDPAVEDFDPVTGNEAGNIDINEGGIVTP
ncbi:MAG: hypothetical protein J5769_01905 [Bacteroidales bacterium]|nr:hypothetical protein [Bacteroidales bacterium]